MCLAEKTARLTVGQIAAAATHQFRQHHERGQIALASEQMTRHCARMGRLHSAREAPAGLHDLPARIVHRRATVMHRAHQRKFIRYLRVLR